MLNSTDLKNRPTSSFPNLPNNQNSEKRGLGGKIFIILLTIVTLGLAIFCFSLYNDKKKVTKELTNQKEQIIKELNVLKTDYDVAVEDNTLLKKDLEEARHRVARYIDTLKGMKADIATLWKFRKQVQILTKEREKLLLINDSLTRSNRFLTRERDSVTSALNEVISYADSLVEQNTKLLRIVEAGSALQLSKLSIEAVKERSSGKFVNTLRAKATDKIRICYTVASNKMTQAGNKYFYIQMIAPNGITLGENNTISNDEQTINYSIVSNFIFENKAVDVCDFVNKSGSKFEKGIYKAKVYNDKLNLVGETDFVLK